MNVSTVCIALLGLLVIGGGFHVSLSRNKERIIHGYPDDPSHYLHKAVRAHGNAIEYVPMIALLVYIVGQMTTSVWIAGCVVGVTVARYLHYFGMLMSSSIAVPQPLRAIGALLTYVFGFLLCGYLLYAGVLTSIL